MEDLKTKNRQLLEFISEYGPPEGLPELDSLRKIIPEKDLWPVNWKTYENHGVHGELLIRLIGKPDSLQEMIERSQESQAFILKYHTEFYRRHKFNPCNGALFFHFKDCWPAVTASVIDYFGKKKKAYSTLKQAFNPVHIMMDWPDINGEQAGKEICRKVYVVNDYLHQYPSLKVKWQILDSGNNLLESKTIDCSVPENSIKEVTEVLWKTPQRTNENYRIKFELWETSKLLSRNEYVIKACLK